MGAVDAGGGARQAAVGGLAAFAGWCARSAIAPQAVDDACVERFHAWLETRTLCPRARDLVRRVPHVWNDAGATIAAWPDARLTPVSFQAPRRRVRWAALGDSLRQDAEAYLALRRDPDIFSDDPAMPVRPLAASTLHLQRENIRVAASVLIEAGTPVAALASLADLVAVEPFKAVLRHYHARAGGKPNAFAVAVARTLIDVARYRVRVDQDALAQMKRLAGNLKAPPFELRPRNKALLRQLQSDELRAKLLFLPETLLREVEREMKSDKGRFPFVRAQVAIAVDILLAVPLRPQNLCRLDWSRHFTEPDGPKGPLTMFVPGAETKSGRKDIVAQIPAPVARRLRWYRRHILPAIGADPTGPLFASPGGKAKGQATISVQMRRMLAARVGVVMSPHKFRHFGATAYLAAHPTDFQTVKEMLGHAFEKTTRIYADACSERHLKVYNEMLFAQREALKLKRRRKRRKD
jgi:integrase